jgi:hypothetical protein
MFRTLRFLLFPGLLAGAVALPAATAPSERSERLVVPLSDPARPARVEVGLVMGSIEVVAGKAGEVVLIATSRAEEEDEEGDRRHRGHTPEPDTDVDAESDDEGHRERERDRAGLQRLPNTSLGLEVEEHDNLIEVGVESWARPVDLRIEVPAASSLDLSTVNAGEVSVRGLSGELELSNTNGEIAVRDVTGPVSASTVNGDVTVVFGRTLAAAAMAFSTLNGDVDVTLPADAKVDVLLRSDNGEILTDFDVVLERQPAKVEEDREQGRYRISVGRDLAGKIGGGGPQLFLKTFNGDILLRKKN